MESLKFLFNSFSEYSEKFELLRRLPEEGIPSVDQRLERRRFNVAVGSSLDIGIGMGIGVFIVEILRSGDPLALTFGDEDLLLLRDSSTMLPGRYDLNAVGKVLLLRVGKR